jgi:hypothetical protein
MNKIGKRIDNNGNGTYMVVGTVERVIHSRNCKKKKNNKVMNEAKSKKHDVVADDTDKLLHPSRALCHLPHIARSMLVEHLERNGVCVETSNLLSSSDHTTDDSDADSSTTSSSIGENSGSKITENDTLLQGSEIFGNLPVVAEDMLVRHLEKEGISSKLDDQLFYRSRQVDLPLAAKKILLKYLKKRNSEESYPVMNKKYILYLPYVEYWLIEVNMKRQGFDEFEREVVAEFPPSFRWLITECARMLQMTVQELYYELVDVEAMHCHLLRPQVESLSEDFKKNIEMYW